MDQAAAATHANRLPLGTMILNWIRRLWDRLVLWFVSVGFSLALTIMLSIILRQRMSHNNGIENYPNILFQRYRIQDVGPTQALPPKEPAFVASFCV